MAITRNANLFLKKYLIAFLILFLQKAQSNDLVLDTNRLCDSGSVQLVYFDQTENIPVLIGKRPHPLLVFLKKTQRNNRKLTAAVLAFPFPFGIVGLHRIYLGSPPHVPVVYIASLGGAFGLLPLIDFFVILLDKNMDNYVNNKNVFMWISH